jgi:glycerol-1-phosphate dehydrogenase [NAD(P)+]
MNIQEIISKYQIPIQQITIADNPYPDFKKFSAGKNFLLVSDQNIYPLFQDKISADKKLILQSPHADLQTVESIMQQAENFDLIVGIGSGTINDLCKLASFNKKIPYVIFASAPSMNGYSSANASIMVEGHKKSLPAHLPIAIFADLEILQNAPERLIKSGLGDSLCFSTCHFDWLLSRLILNTKFNGEIFDLLAPYHQKLFFQEFSSKNLIENLIVSGLGMYIAEGSYPASQGEHLVAHYLEMKYPNLAGKSFHGEQIAVTTLTAAEIQEKILKQENLQIKSNRIDLNYLRKIFSDESLAKHCLEELEAKKISEDQAKIVNQNWLEIKQKLKEVFISKNDLEKISARFNLPKNSQDIFIDSKIYEEAVKNSYLIRSRFTCLDCIT